MRLLSRDSLQVFVIQYHDAARSCVGRLKYGQARDQSSKASYPGKDKRVAYADTPGYTPTPRTPAASMSVLGLERHQVGIGGAYTLTLQLVSFVRGRSQL